MGTLNIITPTGVFSLDPDLRSDGLITEGWACTLFGAFLGNTDDDLIAGLTEISKSLVYYQSAPGVEKTVTVTFSFNNSDPIFELDGNPGIAGNSLPSGFLMSATQTLLFNVSALRPGPFSYLNSLRFRFQESNTSITGLFSLDITEDGFINSSQFTTAVLMISSKIQDYPIVGAAIVALNIGSFDLSGTYVIESFQFTSSPSSATLGSPITVTNNSPTIPIPTLLDITEIQLWNEDQVITIPTSDFIEWTYLTIIFILPEMEEGVDLSVVAVINSTQFTGSVVLGSLSVIAANRSGVYRIIPDQRHDTLYVDSSVSGTTENVVIPSPFIKTGFIGG